jgi:hypothetical protein
MRVPWRRKARPEPPPSAVPAGWIEQRLWTDWEAPRNYVAGEQSYLTALSKVAGPPCEDGYCALTTVTFVREPQNRYDTSAFRAEVDGHHVGYLRAHIAEQLAPAFDGASMRTFEVCALIRGGSNTAPNLGVHVWLNRTLTPGLALSVPPEAEDTEWMVPWPPRDVELALLSQSSGQRVGNTTPANGG